MESNIQFIPFNSPTNKGWDEAWELYQNSFPYKEIRSLEDHLQAMKDPRFAAEGIWLDDKLIGIFYYWRWRNEFYYGEHLAIIPELRNANMGSKVLTQFCAKIKGVILEIDPPIDDISKRRKVFYERLGFVANPQEYLHPSFREPFLTHQLVLMSYPALLTNDEIREFADFIREVVLRYSEHRNPTLPKL
ncbi:MAG: GNAT family N-acetyltransferase [Alistipes sp.]